MVNGPISSTEVLTVPSVKPSAKLAKGAIAALALFTFVLALEMLKTGAEGAAVLLKGLDVHGMTNALGFGWLAAYLVMSGSPVAALSLGLFGGGTLSALETFAMINGSRFGASFVVLFTGFLYYLRGIRGRGVVSMGVLSMITTATIYVPAMLLGAYVLGQQWLARVRLAPPRVFGSVLDVVYGPIVETVATHLHGTIVFVIGLVCLLIAFRLFDRALVPMDSDQLQTRWGRWLERPLTMFVLGLVVTSVTLSVSASLSLLVPLAGRGYVRREHVIPYIMGANISTFVDTLVAALLIQVPVAFTIVLTEMLAVASVSVLVLASCYGPYHRTLLKFNAMVTDSPLKFSLFVAFLGAVPLFLLLI
jgi:hypothetical protein